MRYSPFWEFSPSFALISVLALVSLAALTATAFLASARLERQATTSIEKTTLLEMALNSGKFCVTQLINDYSQADLGNTAIVTYWRTNWTDELGYPFIAQIKTSGNNNGQNSAMWYYLPLFSPAGIKELGTNNIQNAMRFTNTHQGTFSNDMQTFMTQNATNGFIDNPGQNHPTCVQIPLLGGRTSPPVGWVYIHQEKRNFGTNPTVTSPAVRIAWFTEDLEGLIDAERMGSTTNRSSGTNPEEVSLSSATGTNGITLVSSPSTFTNNRARYISYGLLANNSGLANSTNARYFASGLRAWAPTDPAFPSNGALAWIPVGIPVSGSSNAPKGYANQGYTKFNLNNLATNSGSAAQAATNIAQIITSNLSTNFLARAGGLTNSILYPTNDFDYAKCLAANIVDYIDADSVPTTFDGAQGYRGTEALPYLTELSLRYRLEPGAGGFSDYKDSTTNATLIPTMPNRILPSINAYLELWNPYSQDIPVSSIGISFRSYGTNTPGDTNAFAIGCNQFVKTIDEIAAEYTNGSTGSLSNLTFSFSNAITAANVKGVSNNFIPANGYCLIKCDHKQAWQNIGPLTNTNNWLMISTNNYKFIYGNTNSTTTRIYLNRNSSDFVSNCLIVGAPQIANNDSFGNSAICELSFGGIIFDRSRNLRMQYSSVSNNGSSPNFDVAYQSWQPGLILQDPTNFSGRFLNSGDPRITYFLRPLIATEGLFAPLSFSNTSFIGPNTNTLIPDSAISYSSDPSFLNPSCRLDVTQWSDKGHNPTAYGAPPTGSKPETNSANEPSASTVAPTGANKAPALIRNGAMTNILELGNIYDPILWRGLSNGIVTTNSVADPRFGGGNTLRIGRPEHMRFAFTNMYNNSIPWIPNMAQSAAALLDLFCLSNGVNTTNSGPYSLGGGKINLNTAPAPVLRALAGGVLMTNDPVLINNLSAVVANHSVPAGMSEAFAQGVMRFRSKYPFLTPSHLCFIGTDPNWPNTSNWPANSVFGNTNTISLSPAPGNSAASTRINVNEWNDQAAEEWFSKIYALSSCQSHNFRIYVVAQRVATNSSGQTNAVGPLVKKYYQVFFQNGSSVKPKGTNWPATNSTYPNNTIYTWVPTGYSVDIYKSYY